MTSLTENGGALLALAIFSLPIGVRQCSFVVTLLACLPTSYHCQGIASGGKMFMQGGKQFGLRWCLIYCGCRAWKAL